MKNSVWLIGVFWGCWSGKARKRNLLISMFSNFEWSTLDYLRSLNPNLNRGIMVISKYTPVRKLGKFILIRIIFQSPIPSFQWSPLWISWYHGINNVKNMVGPRDSPFGWRWMISFQIGSGLSIRTDVCIILITTAKQPPGIDPHMQVSSFHIFILTYFVFHMGWVTTALQIV